MIPFDATGAFHPVADGRELRRLAVKGAAATITAATLSFGAQAVSTVILARMLSPADFGVVTMVTTFSMLLMSFGINGFEEAIIQRLNIDRFQASNLFWINCGVGLALMVGFAAAGSLLAQFYRNPQVSGVAIAVSPAMFLAATSVVHVALLKRAMRFSAVSTNDVVGRAVNTAVSVLLAMRGWGYFALTAGIVAQVCSVAVGAWCLCRWIPDRPRRGVGTIAMLKYAANVNGGYIANYFTRNFDNLLVGWKFNAGALGFYKKAYDLFALTASQLTGPLHNVALAALSRMQHDPDRFKRYLRHALGIIAFVGMAVGADLTLVGRDLVRLILGPNWTESGKIFEMLAPGIGMMLLYSTVCWIPFSTGQPGRWLRWTLIESTFTALAFLVALAWGPTGIAVAWSVTYWILLVPAFWYVGRPIGFGVSYFVGTIWKYVIAGLFAGLSSSAVIGGMLGSAAASDATEALKFIVVKSVVFVCLYLGAVVLLHRGFDPLLQVAALLRELRRPAPARVLAKT